MAGPEPSPSPAVARTSLWTPVLGMLFVSGGLLGFGALLVVTSQMTPTSGDPDEIVDVVSRFVLWFGTAAALPVAAGWGLARARRSGIWLAQATVWGLPLLGLGLRQLKPSTAAVLFAVAAALQWPLWRAWRASAPAPAPWREARGYAVFAFVAWAAAEGLGGLGWGPAVAKARHRIDQEALMTAGLLQQAQASYAEVNGGLFEARLECLTDPEPCLGDARPAFTLDAALLSRVLGGDPEFPYFRFRLDAPAAVDASARRRLGARSPSSVERWALRANPTRAWAHQSVCADSRGRVCFSPGKDGPDLVDGLCPPLRVCAEPVEASPSPP